MTWVMTRLRADGLLLFAALIWGTAFVAQKLGNDNMPPVMFCGLRFFLAALALAPFAFFEAKRKNARQGERRTLPINRKDMLLAIAVGLSLFGAISLQQTALVTTSATNGGFLTALYILLVPFAAWMVQGIRPRPMVLFACAVSMTGAWLLAGHSANENGASEGWTRGDLLLLLSDIIWAFQIVLISRFLEHTHRPLFLSFVQYGVTGVLGIAAGLAFEPVIWHGVCLALPAILYTALLPSGVAFTAQIVAQRHTPATEAALIMSLESVFAALAGAALLNERLTFLASVGCGLILFGIIMVEIGPLMQRK